MDQDSSHVEKPLSSNGSSTSIRQAISIVICGCIAWAVGWAFGQTETTLPSAWSIRWAVAGGIVGWFVGAQSVGALVGVACGALVGGFVGLFGVLLALSIAWGHHLDQGAMVIFITVPVGTLIGGISGFPFGVGHKWRASLGMGIGGLSGLVLGAGAWAKHPLFYGHDFLDSRILFMSPVIGAVLRLVIGLRYEKEWGRRRPTGGESVSGNGEEKPGGA